MERCCAYNNDVRAVQADQSGASESGLRGNVSGRMLLLLVVGDILGAGIYVLIGELAGEVGGLAWAAFAGARAEES